MHGQIDLTFLQIQNEIIVYLLLFTFSINVQNGKKSCQHPQAMNMLKALNTSFRLQDYELKFCYLSINNSMISLG